MANTTAVATESDGYSNIGHGLSSAPINNLVLILGSIVLLSTILYIFWQYLIKKGSDVSVTGSPKDSEIADNKEPSLSSRKSVRFADEELSEAYVTPQMIPIPQVSLAIASDGEEATSEEKRSPRSSRSSSTVASLFRSLSRSMSLYLMKTDSEDLDDSESSHGDDLHTPVSITNEFADSSETISREMDEMSDDSDPSSTPSSPRSLQEHVPMTFPSRNRSKSEPIKTDENGFYVGEEVQYRGKTRWKRGIVTSINPLKVHGDGNYRARAYEQVRKLRELPEKIGEEVDDMDVDEMTFDDFKRLMSSARQNTRTGRNLLADTVRSQSHLVETLTRNQN